MNKRFIITLVLIAGAIILVTFSARKIALKRRARRARAVELENMESLLDAADSYKEEKDYLKAKMTLEKFVEKFPESKDASKVKSDMQELNMKILFSDIPTEDSFFYKIKPGDALSKIAYKSNTTVELLKMANNLRSDLILPGRVLKVDRTGFRILVDKTENTLALLRPAGEVLKTYRVSTGENLSTPTGTFKIEEKLISPAWYKVGAIVEPESPEYELGSRWMGLSEPGYGIHGTKDASSIGKHITKGCIRMKNEDVAELYAVVPSGTEVTIVD